MTIDFAKFKSAGIYIQEFDNTTAYETNVESLALLVGFSNKGVFNRPVLLEDDTDRLAIFGEINTKLEHKGSYFHRFAQTLLSKSPILALNLLAVDETEKGPDQVNFAAMSLNAGVPNPEVADAGSYGEYDYLAGEGCLDGVVYGLSEGANIPYVGKASFASLFDRSKFWMPSSENLMANVANKLATGDTTSFEHSNFLNFANIGTEEFSILAFKPENLKGLDVTAAEWYGGADNIPFSWIRPSDYMSDYFITVIAVKGNWTNYKQLSTDPIWSAYFDNKGVIKDKINSFISAEGVTCIGQWTGSIIPDFEDKQGTPQNLVNRINSVTEKTGLIAVFNQDAAEVLAYDYNGALDEGDTNGVGTWFYDIDGDNQMQISQGEGADSKFLIDMVGHNFQSGFNKVGDSSYVEYDTEAIDSSYLSKSFVDSSVFYLKSYESMNGEDSEYNVEGSLPFSTPVRYTLRYDEATSKIYLNLDPADNATIGEVNVTRYNQEDSAATVTGSNGAYEISPITPNDKVVIPVSVTVSGNTETKKITYVSPSADPISVDFGGVHYGNYVAIKKDRNGNVVDADVYVLYRKPKTSRGVTSYVDAFEIATSNVNLDVVGSSYKVVYPTTGFKLTYSISSTTTTASFGDSKAYGINFLSYNYCQNDPSGIVAKVANVEFFANAGTSVSNSEAGPVEKDNKNTFIVTDYDMASLINIGDFVNNAAFENKEGEAQRLMLIPGITRVIDKMFINVNAAGQFTYKGETYNYTGKQLIVNSDFGAQGFYLFTTIDAVLVSNESVKSAYVVDETSGKKYYPVAFNADGTGIAEGQSCKWEDENGIDAPEFTKSLKVYYSDANAVAAGVTEYVIGATSEILSDEVYCVTKQDVITRQLPVSDSAVSTSLRFIPMKGLKITSRHRPGYDAAGNISIEGGIEKIYSVLEEEGMLKGLCNPEMADYRYIIDSMGFGLDAELGGKKHLSRVAARRLKTTALLNMPSKSQFAASENPYFCDSFTPGVQIKPAFKVKYIPDGGNRALYASKSFSLPTEDDGSKYAAAFWPYLIYNDNGKKVTVPPAADVANALMRKYKGGDPWMIVANLNGVLDNSKIVGLEYLADQEDRDYLEPMGVNTIIQSDGQIMIYGNQTCYQNVKSDYNKLHIRENLNTIEIECEAVLKRYNFSYNTAAVRASIVTNLTPILQQAAQSGALYAFNIKCDATNNTQEVIQNSFGVCDIELEMTKGMEKMILSFTVQKYGTISASVK